MTDTVTIVVITHNRREQLLRSLAHHEGPVVVVDNASDDGTSDAVRQRFPTVDLVPLSCNLGAAGRTIGVRRASTRHVAFADDDSWWEPGALDLAASILDRFETIGLLAARVVVEPEGREDGFNRVLAASPVAGSPGLPGTPILGFMACAVAFRRDAYLAAGGFDEHIGLGGEEQVLAWDLAAAGWQLRYEPRLTVHHHPLPSSTRGASRQRAIRRAAVLAAIMRRGWPDVAAQVSQGLLASGPDRAGVVSAARGLPRAMRERRPLPHDLRQQIRALKR